MSDVEKFYVAISAKCGNTRKWEELNRVEQQIFVDGLNMIFGVIYQ